MIKSNNKLIILILYGVELSTSITSLSLRIKVEEAL